MKEKVLSAIVVYTDGSCNTATGDGGWVAILIADGEKTTLSGSEPGTTHQRMELTAALMAFQKIERMGFTGREIILYTDSQYLADLAGRKSKLTKSKFTNRKRGLLRNTDLVQGIFRFIDDSVVRFVKIPAHQKASGAENYNREADMRARKIVRDSVRNAPGKL